MGLLKAGRVSSIRVRLLWPEAFCAGSGVPSARLKVALDSFVQWSVERPLIGRPRGPAFRGGSVSASSAVGRSPGPILAPAHG